MRLFAGDFPDDLQDHPEPDNPDHQGGNRREDGRGRSRDRGGIGKRRAAALSKGRGCPNRGDRGNCDRSLDFVTHCLHFFLSVDPQPLRRKSHAGNKRLGN